jgi:hypothetical protein
MNIKKKFKEGSPSILESKSPGTKKPNMNIINRAKNNIYMIGELNSQIW